MRVKLFIGAGLGLYVLLSATDWLMTYALLRSYPTALEANPLAAACLERYGWDGLALYKTLGVLAFIGAVFLLARRKPAMAGVIVTAGCGVLLSVTVYTHQLLCESHRETLEMAEDAAWPKPKVTAENSAIPERCWFAAEPPIATALRNKHRR